MPQGKISPNSARLATIVPKELAEYIISLANKEDCSTSLFLSNHLKNHFGKELNKAERA